MNAEIFRTTRSLVWRCMYALLLLVLLAASNFWIIQQQVRESKALANRVGRYTRQLALVYRASYLANDLLKRDIDSPIRHEAANAFLDIAQVLEHNHTMLIYGDAQAGLPPATSPNVRSIYFSPPSQLNQRMRAYIQVLQSVSQNGGGDDFVLTDEVFAERLRTIADTDDLREALSAVLNYYRSEDSAKIFLVQQLNLWHFCSTLGVLAFVALLVLYPMIRRIQQVMSNLAKLNASLEQRVDERTAALIAHARELEESNENLRELRAAMENAMEGIGRMDSEGKLVSANSAFLEAFQRTEKEVQGMDCLQWLAPDARPLLTKALERARQQEVAEVDVQLGDQEEATYLQLAIVEAHDMHGGFDGHHIFAKNVTGRTLAEQALRESEARFRQLTENLQQVLWLSEVGEDRLVYISPAFEGIFGRPREPLYESLDSWFSAIHPDDRERVAEARRKYLAAGKYDEEYRIVTADGEQRWLRDRAFPIEVDGREARRIAGIAEDITRARDLQQQLLSSHRSFENLIMSCDVAMLVTNSDGVVQFVNPAAKSLLRKSSQELLGTVFSFAVMEEERNEMPILEGGAVVGTAEINLIRTEWDEEVAHLLILQDITDRKIAEDELHAYAAELKRSNKELEDFAFVASHDLQEPLRKIKAFGDRLIKKFGDQLGKDGNMYLSRMQNASQRMDALIRGLLAYSRVTTKAQPFDSVNLNDVVSEVLNDLEVRIEQTGGTVTVDTLPTIEADAMQMRQLFQNLIGNALKFRHESEAPRVHVSSEPMMGRPASIHDTPAEAVQMCRLSVQDNGIGFDEKYLDRIFEVFQRLHGRDAYEGTGTGLAVCRKIANRHNGTITARSAPGKGTTFIVTLPVNQASSDDQRP